MAFAATPLATRDVFPSANRPDAVNSDDFNNYTYRGIQLVIDITTFTDGTNCTFTLKGKDQLSGKYVTILASAAQTGTGTVTLTVYPGIAVTANVSASTVLPKTWRVEVTKTGTFSNLTYSCSATMIP